MSYTPILATLGYVLSPDQSHVLMIHRNARADDPHWGKYNGLGGKLEAHETIFAGLLREITEEAGIVGQRCRLRGTMSWPGFGKQGEDWFGFVFLIETFTGEPQTSNAEGQLTWVARDQLLTLPLWEGDRHFLPLVFDDDPRLFHGVMCYHDQRVISWSVCRPPL